MRSLSALLVLAALAAAPAGADALSRRLLVNGDSLAVGTQPYLPRELARWQVTQSTSISRHAFEGPDVMRAYGRSLPRVIHEVMAVAGPRRWLAGDGLHGSAEGYQARARAVARSVRRCR